jgi:hypothetical protein
MPAAYGFSIPPRGQGVIFALNAPARRDRVQTFGHWQAELRNGTSYICLSAPVADLQKPLSTVVDAADAAAQQFLDIVAVEERSPLLTVEPHDNLTWRTSPHGLKYQLTSSITFSAGLGDVTATVRDAKGNVIPPPLYVPPVHHYAYRYFRYSQAALNLFDGYRNMFLALESILDHIAPKQAGEGETDWLRRALAVAIQTRGLNLAAFLQPRTSDPVEGFLDAHYSAIRCAVFHAKSSGGQAIRPGTLEGQDVVLHQLLGVQSVVEALMRSEFSVRLPQSGFVHSGFGLLLSKIDTVTALLASVGDCPTVEQVLAKEEALPVGAALPVKFAGVNGRLADEWIFLTEIASGKLDFSTVASLRLIAPPLEDMLLGPIAAKMNRTLLRTDLDLDGVTHLVFRIRCILRNQQAPKRGFSY